MAGEISERDISKVFVATSIQWMREAFTSTPGKVQDMLSQLQVHFDNVVASYEEEIKCLKRALPADKLTQTTSEHAPVDSAAE